MKHINVLLLGSIVFFVATAPPLLAYAYVPSGRYWSSLFMYPLQYYDTSGISEDSTAKNDWNNAGTEITLSTGGWNCLYKIKYDYRSDVSWDGLTLSTVIPFTNYFATVDVFINDYYTQSYTLNQRKSVISHEMGHAFGLDNTSGAVVMNGATNGAYSRWETYGICTPQSDDVSGVNSIY
jgi:hypothetical protein